MNREDKEEEAENENESLSGSAATAHKSPGKWFYKTVCFAFVVVLLALSLFVSVRSAVIHLQPNFYILAFTQDWKSNQKAV